jgi:hypothetical protein
MLRLPMPTRAPEQLRWLYVLEIQASIGEPFQDLGERAILSSKAAQIPLSRPPVEEVLRFPISRPTAIHRFDEITIVFLSARERARGGAKVSIQSFTVIPK